MAIWKDQPAGKPGNAASPAPAPAAAVAPDPTPSRPADFDQSRGPGPRPPALKEWLSACELAIEGKIEGAGPVRIAGKFKGDVNVQRNLTIEQGAKLTGS